jgi:hypothetical protein
MTIGKRQTAECRLNLICGQRKPLIRNREFDPSTDVHRFTHRRRANAAHLGDFGRLPHTGFRGTVNGPRDTAARKSRETWNSSEPTRLSDPTFRAVFGP